MSESETPTGVVGVAGFGYSTSTIAKNANADPSNIGARLGKLCIERSISVTEVAEYFGLTRAAVYKWFFAEVKPNKANSAKIQELIDKLTS